MLVAPNMLQVDEVELARRWSLDVNTRLMAVLPKAIGNYYVRNTILQALRTKVQHILTLAKRQVESGQK